MNKIISGLNAARYAMTEPLRLRFERALHAGEYNYRCYQNEEPLVSVIIPTYNRVELLTSRALPCVLGQTYKNLEILVIGDCCTDDTEARVKKFLDPRIKFYNIPKRGYRYPPTAENHWFCGPVVAINEGLSRVTGKWIARIDDDDYWSAEHVEKLLGFATANDYEFVSSHYWVKRDGFNETISGTNTLENIGGVQTWLYRSYLRFMRANLQCWRKSWNKVNDTDLANRIYKAGARIGYYNDITAMIEPRPGESEIGLKAYRSMAKRMENFYRFG
jgi:glycosyltransferase involved in cell wall biosynthesis